MIIRIKRLRAETLLGAYAEERHALRPVTLDLTLVFDHTQAVKTDQLQDTIDYALIEQAIVASLKEQRFRLLESLVEHVAQLVMGFAGVTEVTVEIDKPGALMQAESVSVIHTVKA